MSCPILVQYNESNSGIFCISESPLKSFTKKKKKSIRPSSVVHSYTNNPHRASPPPLHLHLRHTPPCYYPLHHSSPPLNTAATCARLLCTTLPASYHVNDTSLTRPTHKTTVLARLVNSNNYCILPPTSSPYWLLLLSRAFNSPRVSPVLSRNSSFFHTLPRTTAAQRCPLSSSPHCFRQHSAPSKPCLPCHVVTNMYAFYGAPLQLDYTTATAATAPDLADRSSNPSFVIDDCPMAFYPMPHHPAGPLPRTAAICFTNGSSITGFTAARWSIVKGTTAPIGGHHQPHFETNFPLTSHLRKCTGIQTKIQSTDYHYKL